MKFNLDNPVLQFINTACHYITLNLLFLITCLPVVTIGSALSSLYYVTLKESRGEEGYLSRTYLRVFKNNLKVGTLSFAILFIVGAILLFNLVFWFALHTFIGFIFTALMVLATLIYSVIVLYTFPLIGRFENPTKQTLKNAFLIALTNRKATLILLAIDAIVVLVCLVVPQSKLFMVLIGFAFIAYCQSFIFTKVFKQYEPEIITPPVSAEAI